MFHGWRCPTCFVFRSKHIYCLFTHLFTNRKHGKFSFCCYHYTKHFSYAPPMTSAKYLTMWAFKLFILWFVFSFSVLVYTWILLYNIQLTQWRADWGWMGILYLMAMYVCTVPYSSLMFICQLKNEWVVF